MTGKDDMRRRPWSTRQRLVVLTFDTPQQAHQFDLTEGLPPVDALINGFDVENVDAVAIVTLMEACRDVIDVWDDRDRGRRNLAHVGKRIESLRRALFDARQGAIV